MKRPVKLLFACFARLQPLQTVRWAVLVAALVAGFQAFLWAKVQFWIGMAGNALLAGVLVWVAAVMPSWVWPVRRGESARSFGLGIAAVGLLIALLSILCILPIRAGAFQGRALERVVIAVLVFTALLALLLVFRAVVQGRVLRRPVVLVLASGLVAVVIADLMQWMRPSGLAAVACTRTIFRSKPDAGRLLNIHHAAIAEQAGIHDLPASLVAAVMVDHQHQRSASGDLSDCAGSALGVNLSLGLSQMRLGTAALVDGRSLADLSASEYRLLRSRLMSPESNIAYETRELRALRDRPGRFPGMSATVLLHDPAAMALLISEYRKGRMSTAATQSRLDIHAFTTLGLMQDGTVAQFDRAEEDPGGARSLIREYLTQVYCQSGIFNDSTCRSWQSALPRRPAPG